MTPAPDPVVNVWRDQSAAIDAWPSAARFSARTFLETDTCTGVFEVVRARRLLRALGPEDAPLVLARCRAAGRWILRGQGEGGEFLYSQDPVTNRSRGGYNIVRHAGTTMALAQLASRTSDDHFLGGALSGLDFLRGCFRSPEGAPEALYVEFEGVAALGSAALTLLAMLHLPADEWTPSVRAEARALAAFLLNQQRPDGAFVCVYNRSDRVASQNYPSIYYPGEAVLALTRLYAREGDARYLEAAARGARALLRWRPWPASIEELFYENAWLMQALPALYHKTRRKQFRKACFASALRMIRGQWNESNGPAEYAGGLRTVPWLPAAPPATCSTASRTEGLVEAVGLAAATGGPARRLFDATVAAGRFLLEQQFDADTSYFVRSPRDADGCLRESFTVNLTRVDYVQHALSALLGIERLLRQPPLSLEGGG